MTKSCKEIIENAKTLAQIQNSKAFDWRLYINILNGAYTKLYNELTGYSNSFIGYFTFNGKEGYLPSDCNKILMVYKGTEDNPYIISQSSLNNFIPGTYYIENNYIRIVDKKDTRPVTVKYSKLPVTLTFPDDDELLNIEIPNFYRLSKCLCTKKGFYYKKVATTPSTPEDPNLYFYDFEENAETVAGQSSTEPIPYGGDDKIQFLGKFLFIENNKMYWAKSTSSADKIDVTEYFLRPGETELSLTMNEMNSDGNHLALVYRDDNKISAANAYYEVYVMMPDWSKVQINPYISKGIDWMFFPRGICADESTGDYIVGIRNNKYDGSSLIVSTSGNIGVYKASFVPDTILDYPNNTFFDVLEDKVAIQLQSLQGLDNSALQAKLQDDEKSFYDSLERSRAPMRIRNEDNRYKWRYF